MEVQLHTFVTSALNGGERSAIRIEYIFLHYIKSKLVMYLPNNFNSFMTMICKYAVWGQSTILYYHTLIIVLCILSGNVTVQIPEQ